MTRALRYDGVIPTKMGEDGTFSDMTPGDIRAMKAFIDEGCSQNTPFDIIMAGFHKGNPLIRTDEAIDMVRSYEKAGVTWLLEDVWIIPGTEEMAGLDGMRERIKQGPLRANQ